MGRTKENLSTKELGKKAIFNNRFVVECVENFHIHYRNLRIALTQEDFVAVCKGCIQAFERWNRRGCPDNPKAHIELCRKNVTGFDNEGVRINLNHNLYNENKGRIFSEGAEFDEPEYIHLKIRDLRIELSKEEFKELTNAVKEASGRLECRNSSSVL